MAASVVSVGVGAVAEVFGRIRHRGVEHSAVRHRDRRHLGSGRRARTEVDVDESVRRRVAGILDQEPVADVGIERAEVVVLSRNDESARTS